ncbi:MAG TPA: DUF2090 domain-containing protein [Rhodoglobus sp.]|nr:DUF2090 domain-containing protein [Rhodoglobus sp.]
MSDEFERPALAVLAFDHRGEFSRSVFGVDVDDLSPDQRASLSDAKSLILDAYLKAADKGLGPFRTGILADEEYAGGVLSGYRSRDFILAMPVEKADRDVFEFEYGDEFGAHIDAFRPDYAKALVRYNPEDDEQVRATQLERLVTLSNWLTEHGVRFMFELIVRPTPAQLESVGGDRIAFEDQLRPGLVRTAMRQILDAGIHVDLWKIEGVSSAEDARGIVAEARTGRRDVEIVILGAAAEEARVERWLSVAARTEGFSGFAIGRTIWRDTIRAYVRNERSREDAIEEIAENYLAICRRYLSCVLT